MFFVCAWSVVFCWMRFSVRILKWSEINYIFNIPERDCQEHYNSSILPSVWMFNSRLIMVSLIFSCKLINWLTLFLTKFVKFSKESVCFTNLRLIFREGSRDSWPEQFHSKLTRNDISNLRPISGWLKNDRKKRAVSLPVLEHYGIAPTRLNRRTEMWKDYLPSYYVPLPSYYVPGW